MKNGAIKIKIQVLNFCLVVLCCFIKTINGKQKLTAAILTRNVNVFYVFVVLHGPVYEGRVRPQISRREGYSMICYITQGGVLKRYF